MSAIDESKEAREEARVAVQIPVELGYGDFEDSFEAAALNVSRGGLSMSSPCLPDVGAQLLCRFECGPSATPVTARGEVVWAQLGESKRGEFGLCFVDVDPRTEMLIEEMIAEHAVHVGAADEPTEVATPVTRLELEGSPEPIAARLASNEHGLAVFEQDLDLLSLGRAVYARELAEGDKQGSITGVELRMMGNVPTLAVTVAFDTPAAYGEFEWSGHGDDAAPHDTEPDLAAPAASHATINEYAAQDAGQDAGQDAAQDAQESWTWPRERGASVAGAVLDLSEVGCDPDAVLDLSEVDPDADLESVLNFDAQDRAMEAGHAPATQASRDDSDDGDHACLPASLFAGAMGATADAEDFGATDRDADHEATERAAFDHTASGPRAQPQGDAFAHPQQVELALPLPSDDAAAELRPTPVASAAPELVAAATSGSESALSMVAGLQETNSPASAPQEMRDRAPVYDAHDDDEDEGLDFLGPPTAAERARAGLLSMWMRVAAVVSAALVGARPIMSRSMPRLRGVWVSSRGVIMGALRRHVAPTAGAARRLATGVLTRKRRRTTAQPGPAGKRQASGQLRTLALGLLAAGAVGLGVYALAPTGAEDELELHREVIAPKANTQPASAAPTVVVAPVAQAADEAVPSAAEVPASSPFAVDVRDGKGSIKSSAVAGRPVAFGAAAVEGGRTYSLRMSAPVTKLEGIPDKGGFTVIIPGSLSLDRAGPISASHPNVRRSMILNKGTRSELTIRFADGKRPSYRVHGEGQMLHVTIEN